MDDDREGALQGMEVSSLSDACGFRKELQNRVPDMHSKMRLSPSKRDERSLGRDCSFLYTFVVYCRSLLSGRFSPRSASNIEALSSTLTFSYSALRVLNPGNSRFILAIVQKYGKWLDCLHQGKRSNCRLNL